MFDQDRSIIFCRDRTVARSCSRVALKILRRSRRAEATIRSYGMDLLRWSRFLWADTEMAWDRATRIEARDFCRWLQVTGKQSRPHWRAQAKGEAPAPAPAGEAYAPSVRAHSETVLRSFYDFHLDAGSGPIINPFPLDRSRRGGRAHAHHNPIEPYRNEFSGRYRPRVPTWIPRSVPDSVPDSEFNEIFARLPSHRDRALVAFYVSTGAVRGAAGHGPGAAVRVDAVGAGNRVTRT